MFILRTGKCKCNRWLQKGLLLVKTHSLISCCKTPCYNIPVTTSLWVFKNSLGIYFQCHHPSGTTNEQLYISFGKITKTCDNIFASVFQEVKEPNFRVIVFAFSRKRTEKPCKYLQLTDTFYTALPQCFKGLSSACYALYK